MSSENSSIPSASDLITYIGVPLTIVGLLPLAYNVVVTLIHLHKIKRELSRNGTSAKLHSDIFNRIVEVEFTKYLVQPPEAHRDIWTTENCPTILVAENIETIPLSSGQDRLPPARRSEIAGGSWTFLKWDRQELRTNTQRTQPGDKLRQPQAKIRFWDLMIQLYAIGARPDIRGWSELRARAFWARNCPLMTYRQPGFHGRPSLELRVASHGNSDGLISLEFVEIESKFDWWSLQNKEPGITAIGTITLPVPVCQDYKQEGCHQELSAWFGALTCRITDKGLTEAIPSLGAITAFTIEHLRINNGQGRAGVWFASCATALSFQGQTPILEYIVPTDIRQLIKVHSISDDIVKLLFGLGMEEIPTRVTARYLIERKRLREGRIKGQENLQQAPIMDDEARRETEIREKSRIESYAYISRVEQALSSPTVNNAELQVASINWSRTKGHIPENCSLERATMCILSRMLVDQEFSSSLCQMLEHWKNWIGRGALNVEDFCILNHDKPIFAQASLMIATLSSLEDGPAATLVDMQECAAKWEYVELG